MSWPTKKLGEVLEYEQPTKYLVSSTEYRDDYRIPVLTAGKSFILGKTNEKSGIFPKEKLPVIIFDDFTTAIKFVDFPFKVKSSAMKILHAKKNEADIKYLFYKMQTIKFAHNQHKRYWISECSNLEIPLPPIGEQRRIVAKIEKLFAKIDEASRFRAESSAASAALVPSALHQIFSMPDTHSPIRANRRIAKTRWEVNTISKVTEINPSKKEIADIKTNMAVSFVSMASVSATTQSIEGKQERKLSEVKKGYTYFRENDVLFAKITPCMENGKITVAKNLKGGIGFGSTEFHVVRAKEKILPTWLFYFLWNPEFREEAKKHMTGTAGQQRVPVDFLRNSKIPLPPIAEQKKIVAYLDALSQKSRALQNLQSQTAADFSALRQSILHRTFQHS